MNENFLTIITPSFNSYVKMEKYLVSLENQTYNNFKVIIIDDCSHDDTYLLLKKRLKESKLNYLLMINDENLGPGKSRNKALKVADSKYITFIDSDDYISDDFVEIMYKKLNNNFYDVLIYDYYEEKKDLIVKKDSIPYIKEGPIDISDAISYARGSTWGKIYSTELIKSNSVLFPDLRRSEDIPFTKISLIYSKSIYYLKKNLYYYVQHDDSLMHTSSLLDEKNALSSFEIIENEFIKNDKINFIERIFMVNLLYSVVQTKIKLKKSNREIKKFINECTSKYPEWIKWLDKYSFPRLQRIFLKQISKNRIFILKFLVKTRVFLSKIRVI